MESLLLRLCCSKGLGKLLVVSLAGVILTFAGSASARDFNDANFCPKAECAEKIEQFRHYALNGSNSAMLLLAIVYANGEGVDQDLDEARKWMKESIRLRNAHAFHVKSGWRRSGIVFDKDLELANYWLERAVDAGYAPALHEQAVRNLQSGVADDATIDLLEEAADQGHSSSMYILARILELNTEEEENVLTAGQLYSELAHVGYRDADQRLLHLVEAVEDTSAQGAELAQKLRDFSGIERIEVRAFQGDFIARLEQFRMSLDKRGFDRRRTGTRIRRTHLCDESAIECHTVFNRRNDDQVMGPSTSVGAFLGQDN